jgi:hypothetical protein
MDLLLEQLGYVMGESHLSALAFADDLIAGNRDGPCAKPLVSHRILSEKLGDANCSCEMRIF